jgi:bacterioferritin-associated ferredoxin
MIVCVCHHVSDRKLAESIAKGATSMKALGDELGVGRACGKCTRQCKAVLQDQLQPAPSGLALYELALNA